MQQQGVLHCEVCDAELPSLDSMSWHIKGKRHQKSLQYWDKKQQQARLCVFVRGFPFGTTEQELWQYFAQFGRVTGVTVVKPKNLYAIVEFAKPDIVEYVMSTPNHRLNSQNLIVKRREVEAPNRPPTNRFEQGYGGFRQSGNLGSDYGPRGGGRGMHGPGRGRGGRGDGGSGLLAYGRSGYQEGAQGFSGGSQDFSRDSYGGGPHGDFGEPAPQKNKQTVDDQIDMYYHEELLEKLIRVKGVQNQLEWLCQNLQVTAEEAQAKFTLCEKLQGCLGRFFPGCTVNQFGSSVNGFGLSGCDMDIFLDLTTMHSRTWEVEPIQLPFVRDFKFLKEKEWGPLLPADLNRVGMGDQCKLISRILNDNMPHIHSVQVIPSTKCPLVRFKTTDSDIKCDLSVNNKLALQNTKLLYLFSVLNSRVRLLVYAIRYWAKVKGIAGNFQASTKMSNYALTLMILNYLQSVEPPVLPTVEKLSNLHGPANRSKIEGWDCTFAMDWQIIPQSNNTQTAAELLSGFFAYWSAFNFNENILITRTGLEMPFIDFFNKDNMTDGRIRSFKASAVNIQDPFVLNHNLTQNVNEKMQEKVIREFRIAAIKTSVWGNEGFSMTNPSGGGDLVHLLNQEVPDIIAQEEEEKKEQIMERGRMPVKGDDYTFGLEFKPQTMTPKILKQIQKAPNYRVEWCRKMVHFVTRVMKEILLLTIEEMQDATPEIRAKIAEEEQKKAAADRRNNEIRKRRDEKMRVKRQELEAKMKANMEEMKLQMEKEEAEAAERFKKEAAAKAVKEAAEREKQEAEEKAKPDESEEAEIDEDDIAEGGEDRAKAGEKRARPKSIFDLDLETPKRFKGKKGLEFNPDEYIKLSDEEEDEEIIEYIPELPEMKFRRESTAEIDHQSFMRAWCMTWARRKKVKNYLVNQENRREDGIPMEKLISETIYQNDQAPLPKPVVGFYCYMASEIEGNDTKVNITMECKEGSRDFNTFYQFTKIYLGKMVEKYFY